MNEKMWLEGDKPLEMIWFLTGGRPPVPPVNGKWVLVFREDHGMTYEEMIDKGRMPTLRNFYTTARQLRLYACAVCRHPGVWQYMLDTRSRKAVSYAESCQDLNPPPGSGASIILDNIRFNAHEARIEVTDTGGTLSREWEAAWIASMLLIQGREDLTAREISGVSDYINLVSQMDMACIIRDIIGNPFRPATSHKELARKGVLHWNRNTIPSLAKDIFHYRKWVDMPWLGDALLDAGCDDEVMLEHCRAPVQHHVGCWVLDTILGLRVDNG